MDFKFDWSKKMEIGLEEIDRHHQTFFQIGREVEQLLLHNGVNVKRQEVIQLICELREFCSYHFYFEETMMETYQYSNKERHKKEHQAIINTILKLNRKGREKEPAETLRDMKGLMQDWTFGHLLKEDFVMAKEINQKKLLEKK